MSANSLGTLSLDLIVQTGGFEAGMDQAARIADRKTRQIEQQAIQRAKAIELAFGNMARGIAAPLAGAASIAGLASSVNTAVDSLADLKDMAEKTGAAVGNLSALKDLAKIGNHDMGEVEGGIIRLNKALHGTDDESKGAGKALAAMGLDLKKLRDMDPAEAMLELAKAQENFADGGGKSAAMMAILGKNGAALIPYLKDLAEQGQLVGKVTTEQAIAADEYQKNVKKLQFAWGDLSKQMAVAVVGPAKDITDWMVKAQKEGGALNAVFVGLGMSMAKAMGVEINPTQRAENQVNDLFKELQEKRRIAEQQRSAGWSVGDWLAEGTERDIKAIEAKLKGAIASRNRLLQKASDESAPKSTALNTQNFGSTPKAPDTPDPHANDYSKTIQGLNEKIAVQTEDLLSVEKLTQAQKEYAKFQADISSGALVLTESQKQVAGAYWEVYRARTAQNETDKADKKAGTMLDDYKRANELITDRIGRESELATMSQRSLAIAQALYKVEDDGKAIRERIIRDIEDETAQKRALIGAETELALQRARVASATGNSFDSQKTFAFGWKKAFNSYAEDAGNAAKQAQDTFQSVTGVLENAIVQFTTTGKLAFKDFAKSVLQSLAQIAAKQAAMGLAKLAIGAVGSMFGPSTSSAGPSAAAGGGTWLGNTSSYSLNANAKGGVYSSPSLHQYANQIHDTPKLFQFAKGGVFAEAGPEAIMPLSRGADGKLGVRAEGGHGDVSVTNNITINSDGSSKVETHTGNEGKRLGDMMANACRQVLVEEMRSGGMLSAVKAR
ncbi:phage tail tape measure protein [Ferribacterium limneticum]|uniref:phage tail tape measure protein n=1 Tax=Ferribacterium limneticum TaxID=76259 RepID=UPI001CFA1E18|nr:phage tail tape measure protein [Ferribacterium limneticum]UCV27011.1 phage tail tape measure protein [Ferribacterium limneticum]UCV30928.1 phage tail tape measure protein [Ferribacterium limneticum]